MLRTLTIKNYKSILDHTFELGRINVFIGENGCGKTNILEAAAVAGAAAYRRTSFHSGPSPFSRFAVAAGSRGRRPHVVRYRAVRA